MYIYIIVQLTHFPCGFHGGHTCNAGDPGSITGLGRSSGEGNGNLLQYSCLENSLPRGAWWAIVHGITELDMTEQLTGEGNGTPLQSSCLENPMDGGAWWAAVHGS